MRDMFLTCWFYFWGTVACKVMLSRVGYFGFPYRCYAKWMLKSADYDKEHRLWKLVDKGGV